MKPILLMPLLLASLTLSVAQKFDCTAVGGWSKEKSKWCCEEEHIKCSETLESQHQDENDENDDTAKEPVVEYDCIGLSLNWSVDQREWCCNHKNVACDKEVVPHQHRSPWELPAVLVAALSLLLCGVTLAGNLFSNHGDDNMPSDEPPNYQQL